MNRRDLLGRRLLFVVGKGGVGKTSVSCALAIEAARRGARTLLVEVDGVGRAAQLFDIDVRPPGEVAAVGASLFLMNVEGTAALAEYLMMTVPVKRVLQGVLHSRVYQYFVAAAPGLKELMTVGKIWFEANRKDESTGRPAWDLVIVDAPSTGHSLQYLAMPQAALDAFPSGFVHREASHVVELLQDAQQTGVVLVTTAEEMPVNETVEMHGRLSEELHLPQVLLVVNRVHQTELQPADVERLAKRLEDGAFRQDRVFAEEILRRAREEIGWLRINQRYLDRLTEEVRLPRVVLPFLFSEEFGLAEIKMLSDLLSSRASDEMRKPRVRGSR